MFLLLFFNVVTRTFKITFVAHICGRCCISVGQDWCESYTFNAQIFFKHWKDIKSYFIFIHFAGWVSSLPPKFALLSVQELWWQASWMSLLGNVWRHSTYWLCILGICSGGFDGDLLPLGSGVETLKDKFLSVDKILFFLEESIIFCILQEKLHI